MKHIFRDGQPAVPDDMPPNVRALAFLLEHANNRKDDGLPLPCPCAECEGHRQALVGVRIEDFHEGWKGRNPFG